MNEIIWKLLINAAWQIPLCGAAAWCAARLLRGRIQLTLQLLHLSKQLREICVCLSLKQIVLVLQIPGTRLR